MNALVSTSAAPGQGCRMSEGAPARSVIPSQGLYREYGITCAMVSRWTRACGEETDRCRKGTAQAAAIRARFPILS